MKSIYEPKPLFIERIKKLLNNEEDVKKFFEFSKTYPEKSIRVNNLKISPENLIKRLKQKNWELEPLKENPEIIIIKSKLKPGELGKTIEHLLGYYYIQEITSMMPIIALQPNSNDTFLDLCASPGSKTTQAAALMKNKGTIIANDMTRGRTSILSANLERNGVTNTIITKQNGIELCEIFKKLKLKFDKILIDMSCSGEGTIRTCPQTFQEWSLPLINKLAKDQKKLTSLALEILKPNGELLYSTCTYAPEENELVIQHLIDNFNIQILPIELPIKTRPGITNWENQKLSEELKKAVRIYHHDNNTEGFFLCKIKKLK